VDRYGLTNKFCCRPLILDFTEIHWIFFEMKHADGHDLSHFMQCMKRRAFSLVSYLELDVFRGENVPGPHFRREDVDNGEDWREVCTQRSAFMAFDIARWHVTCIFMRGKWSYQFVIRCVLRKCIGILIMPYWASSSVVASLQASTSCLNNCIARCPKNCTVRFTFSHAIQTYWCLENAAFRLLVSSSTRLV